MEPLSDEWVIALAEASAAAGDDQIGDRSGLVAVTIGKKQSVVVSLVDGRFVADRGATGSVSDDRIDLTLPFDDPDELAGYLSGRRSMAKAYIRGDFKPVGSTGVLLSVIELVESGALKSLG
ncbi:MAG: hypothetical protein OER95_16140 [Acidimicrobiia bacterium]|nr:hypothetical protein [Acidimicrobiia bacterium]